MTTREYFRHLRGQAYAEDREICLDIWQIAELIVRGNNFPDHLVVRGWPFRQGIDVDHIPAFQLWERSHADAEARYVDLLLMLRAGYSQVTTRPRPKGITD